MSKTLGTPFTRITRDEAAAIWARNGEVWAMYNDDLKQVRPLNPGDEDVYLTWSVRIIEAGQAVFYVRGELGDSQGEKSP